MIRFICANEKLFFGLIGLNVSLEAVRRFVLRFQPELTFLLTVVQIVVGVLAIVHVLHKWVRAHNSAKDPATNTVPKANEIPPHNDSP